MPNPNSNTDHATSACILSIGTELTSGDVLNRNAVWLSERLVAQGMNVRRHIVVADDPQEIMWALTACQERAAYIFITGGLGPTTDDITRNIIADFAEEPLTFAPESWSRIEKRLSSIGVVVAESNRQQCYFPRGAKILANHHGTADAFQITAKGSVFTALPGPPSELQGIWQDHLASAFADVVPAAQRNELKIWHCHGLSESRLGELTEEALRGSGVMTGYRSRPPYIDVKVWIPPHLKSGFSAWQKRLEEAIGTWVLSQDGADIMDQIWPKLKAAGLVRVVENGTRGLLHQRFADYFSRQNLWDEVQGISFRSDENHITPPADQGLFLYLNSNTAKAGWQTGIERAHSATPQKWQETGQTRFSRAGFEERHILYSIEKALILWSGWLSS